MLHLQSGGINPCNCRKGDIITPFLKALIHCAILGCPRQHVVETEILHCQFKMVLPGCTETTSPTADLRALATKDDCFIILCMWEILHQIHTMQMLQWPSNQPITTHHEMTPHTLANATLKVPTFLIELYKIQTKIIAKSDMTQNWYTDCNQYSFSSCTMWHPSCVPSLPLHGLHGGDPPAGWQLVGTEKRQKRQGEEWRSCVWGRGCWWWLSCTPLSGKPTV